MSLVAYNELPSEARLWAFNADQDLDDTQVATLGDALGEFLNQWTMHRVDVPAGFDIRYGRFILIGADTTRVPPAGCSIDSMMRFLLAMQGQLGVTIVDAPDVSYRDADGVHSVGRARFAELAASGDVTSDTTVFDNTTLTVGEERNGMWEKAAKDSWHGRAFELKESVEHQR